MKLDQMKTIIADHKNKSNLVKRLHKKLKKKSKSTVPLEKLKLLLAREEYYKIDPRDYFYDDDDTGFSKDIGRKEARIDLLKELIKEASS